MSILETYTEKNKVLWFTIRCKRVLMQRQHLFRNMKILRMKSSSQFAWYFVRIGLINSRLMYKDYKLKQTQLNKSIGLINHQRWLCLKNQIYKLIKWNTYSLNGHMISILKLERNTALENQDSVNLGLIISRASDIYLII